MTWAQTITIVAPILVALIAGVFYSNRQFEQIARRIDDLRTDMNARFSTMDARFSSSDARFASIDARFAEIHQDLREMRGLLHEALRPRAS